MQEKYFGDKHDFYKYLFLKNMAGNIHYSLGIHWCLIEDDNSNQGNSELTTKEEKLDKKLYELLLNNKGDIDKIKEYFNKETIYFNIKIDIKIH